MRRYELWVDKENRLVVSEYGHESSLNERRILRGSNTYNLIKLLCTNPILNYSENEKEDRITLEFENYIINLNELSNLIDKRGMGPIISSIKKYQDSKVVKTVKKKKVTRKNKYSKGKLFMVGGALIIIAGIAFSMNNSKALTEEVPKENNVEIVSTVEKISEVNNIENIRGLSNITVLSKDSSTLKNKIQSVSIDYGDRSETSKAYKTKVYYGDMICKYAARYGVDPNLVTAIATQERGVHGTTIDEGGAIGLMQMQYDVWANKPISAYNFETGKRESFIVDDEKLSEIDYNIKLGCMYLQNCMEYMNYNTVAAVQCYNMGSGSMEDILKAYSNDCGKSVKEILSDQTDIGWLEYRHIPKIGDPEYIENVFSYLGEDSYIENIKRDGTVVNTNINNQVSSKKIY